jgi:hypothetical protein
MPKPAKSWQSRPRIGTAAGSRRRPASWISAKTSGMPASGMAARISASLSAAGSAALRGGSGFGDGAGARPPAAKRSHCMASHSPRARRAAALARATKIRRVAIFRGSHPTRIDPIQYTRKQAKRPFASGSRRMPVWRRRRHPARPRGVKDRAEPKCAPRSPGCGGLRTRWRRRKRLGHVLGRHSFAQPMVQAR